MKTYLIDANFLLRFLLCDNPEQYRQIVKYFNLAKNNQVKLILPALIVAETVHVLEQGYEFKRSEIVSRIGVIINTPYIETEDRQYLKQALLTFMNKKIHFTDCYLFERAMVDHFEILTFDKDLIKLYNDNNDKK